MSDPNCIFCKIVNKEIPAEIIFEDNDVIAIADTNPVNLGHTLVIPKEHFANIYDTPDAVLAKLLARIKIIARTLKKVLAAEGININMNNEPAAGQVIFHAHFHVIPRFESDGFTHWHGKKHTIEEIREAAEQIRKAISD